MSLKNKIIELNLIKISNVDIYLFGSVVYSNVSNDIDMAIIYDKNQVAIQDAITYRNYIRKEVAEQFDCNCDILLLSHEEEVEANFLSNAKHYRII